MPRTENAEAGLHLDTIAMFFKGATRPVLVAMSFDFNPPVIEYITPVIAYKTPVPASNAPVLADRESVPG